MRGETPSPLEKLLSNSRENAVGPQTPRAFYLLELAPDATLTLPTIRSKSDTGTRTLGKPCRRERPSVGVEAARGLYLARPKA
jgi:hypothetical protein